MLTVNMHEAKTHLSKLVEKASNGEPFIIARAGKPLVQVTALAAKAASGKRKLGFLKGQFRVPKDFKAFARAEIEEMFFANQDKLSTKKRKS